MKQYLLFIITLFYTLASFAQNYNLSNGVVFDGEPYMVVDPANSQHIVVAWIGFSVGSQVGIKTKVSFDGGASWSASRMLPHYASTYHSADPSIAFDTAGNLVACYIDYRESPDSGGVYIVKSTDGGLNWGFSSKVIDAYADGAKRPIDRPWLAINPLNNHFYITTKPAPWIPAPNRAYFISSTNSGATWIWRYVDTTGSLIGSLIAEPMTALCAGNDGVLHLLYPSYVPSQNIRPGFLHAQKSIGASTFIYNGAYYSSGALNSDTLAKVGYSMKADPSDPQHLVFVLVASLYGDMDVFILESRNGGLAWSVPQRVNDDPIGNKRMQDLCWADFDQDGDLIVAWRDRRNAPDSGYETTQDIWGAVRWKDSSSFSPNFRIADTMAPYNATYLSQSGNDFMNVVMMHDTIYAVWGDVRTTKLNIFFAKRALRSGTTSIQLLQSENLPDIKIFPNPGTDIIHFTGNEIEEVNVLNASGQLVFQGKLKSNNQEINASTWPSGMYFLNLKIGEVMRTYPWVKK